MNVLLSPVAKNAEHDTLAHVAARLAGPVSTHLMAVARYEADVVVSSSVAIFRDWQPPSAAVFAYRLASCAMMVAVDDDLADALLERQFGGVQTVTPHKASGQCRATASLAREIAVGVARAIAEIWPGGKLYDVVATTDASQFARADDNVATITLALSGGHIRVAFAIEGIARISGAPVPPRIADWATQLRASALSAQLPVRAVLARPQFPAATVMRLSVGDVLPISKPVSVPLYAGAHRLATGVLTENDGRTVVQIQRMESMTYD